MSGLKFRKFLSIQKTPAYTIVFLLVIFAATNFTHRKWTQDEGPERGVIKWDVIFQYSYLPATFIYHDIKLDFTEESGFVNDNKFWFQKLDSGNRLIIRTMGMSYLYAPFFFMAHVIAPLLDQPRDGF